MFRDAEGCLGMLRELIGVFRVQECVGHTDR